MREPTTDASAVTAALETLAAAPRLVVALDFDGTLAPFADEPSQVGALPGSWAAVLTLHRAPDTEVVLVSGRPLDSLAAVSYAPEGMALVGSHGVEWRVDGHDEAALTDDEAERVARVGAALDEVGARYPGVVIEHKPAGHGVHTRRVSAEVAARADADASEAAHAADPDVLERGGKDIVEFAVRHVTKGDAIVRLRELHGADAVFFAGDDVTDEDAFRVLGDGDVGVKVGPGETTAGYRVADPAALTDVLKQLARLRATR
ncbi:MULTISPECIES: trehalose-phosphatase [unclassified Curtobacterium]|uniref:trehalose-phosphatase n=1 Tax=unclassified Curtobacterium TaxID=257496 RepID=UPI0008DE29A5|nr:MULTISPECIES: trehalose-phosphatase [unclassified Curtobacterium]OIH92260.1 trehalose-phosphatase [Curtobacterium sp. MCBA15_003]OII10385.1 trehalose-phosphatase [Curtobacterium sp. MCBA15_009]OII30239.1 trehalose-phosphatase [Curtobacterium sp. MMLR14_006]